MTESIFHNWPDRAKSRISLPRRACSLTPPELHARICELHVVRHRLLDVAIKRDLTPGELRLARHVLRELDWYELREAWPGMQAMEERVRGTRRLVTKLKRLLKKADAQVST